MAKRHTFGRTALGGEGTHHGFRALCSPYLAARGKEGYEESLLTIDRIDRDAWKIVMYLILEQQSKR
jgi:hypothetical protein